MRNLGKALLSILIGNLIYFWASPRLPSIIQHRPNTVDYGLGVDFLVCVVMYIIINVLFLRFNAQNHH